MVIFVVLVISSTLYELRLKYKQKKRDADLTDATKPSVPSVNGSTEIRLTNITMVTGSLTQQTQLADAKSEEKQSCDQNGSTVELMKQSQAEPKDASKPGQN